MTNRHIPPKRLSKEDWHNATECYKNGESTVSIAKKFQYTQAGIIAGLVRMGVSMNPTKQEWNSQEIAVLKGCYPSLNAKELPNLLNGRNEQAIKSKVSRLNLRKSYGDIYKGFSQIPEIERSYIAGFFDGEGCVHIGKYMPKGRKTSSYTLHIHACNTDKGVIDYFHKTFKDGRICIRKESDRRNVLYIWEMKSQKAMAFLEIIRPFLKIKKDQADIAIDFQRTLGKSHYITQEDLEYREESRLRLIKMKNHKIPNSPLAFKS